MVAAAHIYSPRKVFQPCSHPFALRSQACVGLGKEIQQISGEANCIIVQSLVGHPVEPWEAEMEIADMEQFHGMRRDVLCFLFGYGSRLAIPSFNQRMRSRKLWLALVQCFLDAVNRMFERVTLGFRVSHVSLVCVRIQAFDIFQKRGGEFYPGMISANAKFGSQVTGFHQRKYFLKDASQLRSV